MMPSETLVVPMLSTPRGMMTSAYFLVWENTTTNILTADEIVEKDPILDSDSSQETHGQTEFFESRLDKRGILSEDLLQVSTSFHVT